MSMARRNRIGCEEVILWMLFALIVSALKAQETDSNLKQSPLEVAQQGLIRQQQIQINSKKTETELSAMIDEYERNGLNDNKLKSLKNLKGILGRLSGEEMDKVLALLKTAGNPSDEKASLSAIAGAYSQQKKMLIQFKQILSMYESDQVSVELAESVRQLADRETVNLQAGIGTVQWTLAKGTRPVEGAIVASLQAQGAEQNAINEESKILLTKIESLAKESRDPEIAARFNKGNEAFKKITPYLDAAAESLSKKKLDEAVNNEKTARDQMRQLVRVIAIPKEDSKLLQESSATLDRMISLEKTMLLVSHDTQPKNIETWVSEEFNKAKHGSLAALVWNKALKKEEVDRLLALPQEKMIQEEAIRKIYDNYRARLQDQLSGLDDQQKELANQADLLSQDLESTAKPVAELLRNAIPPMQEAGMALAGKDLPKAETAQKSAIDLMEKVKVSLDKKIADAIKMEALAGDKIAQMRDLQKQTQAIQAEQATLSKMTIVPKTPLQALAAAKEEAGLQAKVALLQQQAISDAPKAAEALEAAAVNLKQATGAMANPPQVAQVQNRQEQAEQNLAMANQELEQQINQLTQVEQELETDEKALKEVGNLIEAEQKLQLDLAKEIPNQVRHAALIGALASRQGGIKKDTESLQKTITIPDSQQPLTNAIRDMKQAQISLGNADAQRSQSDLQKALEDLFSIKQTLEKGVQLAKNQLGQSAPDASPSAQAEAALAQAQANLNQAMQQLDKNSNSAAATQFAKAATLTGAAAAQTKGLPVEAEKAMQSAATAIAQASGAAGAGQKMEALNNGKNAQNTLSQASAALAQMKSGVSNLSLPNPASLSRGDDKGSQRESGPAATGGENRIDRKGQFLGLPSRERATIQQAQSEKSPQQYSTKVEQYYKNLSNESSRH